MRSVVIALGILVLVTGCAGYRQDAEHRSASSSGDPSVSTGPTADPDAHTSALPRAVVAMGSNSKGDLPILAIFTGSVLLAGLVLGVYTVALVYRRVPGPR